MSINSNFIYESLLRHNYLPAQRKKKEELPPVFDSTSFTPAAASALLGMKPKVGTKGFDLVEYRATKFNGVARSYQIPHPVGYAQLADCIRANWADIEPFQTSSVSMIRPREHRDGRIIIMDYESFPRRSKRVRELAFGKRYTARTDITNCFPSLYTHSIPWAAVGVTTAKANTKKGVWYNDLDSHARRIVRDETQGVPVGPATSNIIAEIILGSVDKLLDPEFKFKRGTGLNGMSRFIDDYTFHCDSHDEAEKFIRRVGEEIGKYKLKLNSKKTSISNEIGAFSDSWSVDLSLRIPEGPSVNAYRATNYLEYASMLAMQFPGGSVLKYAATTIVNCPLDLHATRAALDYLLVLAMRSPALLPCLEKLLEDMVTLPGAIPFQDRFFKIIENSAEKCRSDGMSWGLYYLAKHKVVLPERIAQSVLSSRDCIAISMLYISGQHAPMILDWVNTLDGTDDYELDRYWILLYQLYCDGCIGSNMSSIPKAFEALKASGVRFVHPVS